jgi:hypothetical protein
MATWNTEITTAARDWSIIATPRDQPGGRHAIDPSRR